MEGDSVSWLDATFIGHGHCYLWNDSLVWLHVTSDTLISLSYLTIPIALIYLVRHRDDRSCRQLHCRRIAIVGTARQEGTECKASTAPATVSHDSALLCH